MTTESSQIKQKKYCLNDNRVDETQYVLTDVAHSTKTEQKRAWNVENNIYSIYLFIFFFLTNGHLKEVLKFV